MQVFSQAGVAAILHAGDVTTPRTLADLAEIAPVYAVRGNRDWLRLRQLPLERRMTFNGAYIVLTHGHGSWWQYLLDKVYFLLEGYRLKRYLNYLKDKFPKADVIVFGHTHYSVNLRLGRQLIFNPGSPHFPGEPGESPSVGLLFIDGNGKVSGEIVELPPIE